MLRRYFIAGLLVWLPILVTFFVIKFIVDLLDKTVKLLPYQYQPDQLLGFHIPGLGLVFTLIILMITGLLTSHFIGHKLMHFWERLLSRIPLIRSIHSAVKQVTQAIFNPSSQSFRKVLLIQYPRPGIWSVGFLTSDTININALNEPVVTAFIPTTPNPTSGFLTVIPKKDTIELDISVEQALRLVISLGVVLPDQLKPTNE